MALPGPGRTGAGRDVDLLVTVACRKEVYSAADQRSVLLVYFYLERR